MGGRLATVVGVILGAGCSGPPAADAVPEWEVASVATVSIGQPEGDSVQLFQRIADLDVAMGGELIVADAGLGVVRIFSPEGEFLAQAGRLGDGPGEFRWLRSVSMSGDREFVAWDSDAARLTYFDMNGLERRSVPIERSATANGSGTLDFLVGAEPDGSVLIGTVGLSSRERIGPDVISVERFGPDGRHVERVLETTGFYRDRLAERLTGPVAFSPRPMFALSGAGLYHTTGERPFVFREALGTRDSIPVPIERVELGASWEVLRRRLEELDVRLYDQALDQAPRPDSLPALAGLMAGRSGALWVKAFDPRTDALWLGALGGTGGVWWVISPDGNPVARVSLPEGFAPHVATDSSVIGVHTDDLGVQRVRVHRVTSDRRR